MNGLGKTYLKKRVRATDYLVVAQLFLQDNFLLERELTPDDIKPRLLGHWGTCHGIDIAYANLKYYFGERRKDWVFILGPGHGFPALQANLFLDGELQKVDRNLQGTPYESLAYLCKNFSWPGGYPSHASPLTPGVICEGGELGYALGTAFGASLGHPEKTIAVLLGDGEFETATCLSSLNLIKLFNSRHHGSVLPILHLNGYKISGPTVPARKSERELLEEIRGFGYTPLLTDGTPSSFEYVLSIAEAYFAKIYNPHANLEIAYGLKENVCAKEPPFIIMKTEKGAGGPEYSKGKKIAGNYLAHQIPLKEAKTDVEELKELEAWLQSYRFAELFDAEKGFTL
ncbi:hypothetical protein IJ114_02865 [Candidatus Saccharibacteria bacterium]|nr:hypothetical protein [Candidatus Saccharibacteria bacterium]